MLTALCCVLMNAMYLWRTGVPLFEDEDELLVDEALAGDVFTFIRNCIAANADFHREVWFVCRANTHLLRTSGLLAVFVLLFYRCPTQWVLF